jgi:hypothetical protein
MQITLNVPDTLPPEFLKRRIQEIEKSLKKEAKKFAIPQPEITKGNKNIDINDLFGIWKKQPKDLIEIRKQAWQRSGLEE